MSKYFKNTNNGIKFTSKVVEKYTSIAIKQLNRYKTEIIVISLCGVVIDDIKVRYNREKERREYEKSAMHIKKAMCQHEAEIKVLKKQADKSCEVELINEQLTQVLQELQKEGAVDEQI